MPKENLQAAYDALLNAKASEGLKRDLYAKANKLYDSTTYQWIITAMSHLDHLIITENE